MKKSFLSTLALAMLSFASAWAADYGLPASIQDGNILHCFDWTFNDIKAELPAIAEAGFGAVQVSPVQGNCSTNAEWFYAYMPYDFKFRANGNGSRQQLQALCTEAEKYGIKIIVDVVANHVNQASGYHDPWWDSNGRVRWNGGINYGDRYSITHGQLGQYGDVNSEDAQVQARAKEFVEDLKSLGVKGIRWDAAKHIGLPSEGCNFWKTVCSVPGMYHYGEILDGPGGNANTLMKEYTQYMSVTDNDYSNQCRNNDGVPGGHAGWASSVISDSKVVYWAESHDDYSNEWQASTHVSQAQIDRAWAIGACRKGAAGLYFSRPAANTRTTIKMGQKGSVQFKQPQIAQVNKLRNLAIGKADYFTSSNGAACVTRQGVGAVIVKRGGGGSVTIANGGGYCPAGQYKDKVSGATFTVTATSISGNVGSSGIAVLYLDGATPDPNPNPNPNPDPNPTPDPTPSGSLFILGNLHGAAGWGTTPGTGVAMTGNGSVFTAKNVVFEKAAGETKCYFNLTDFVGTTWDELNESANRYGASTEGEAITPGTAVSMVKYANGIDASGCLSWTLPEGTYDLTADLGTMKLTVVKTGDAPDPTPTPTPDPGTGYYVYLNNNNGWNAPCVWAWNDSENCTAAGTWPGDMMTNKGEYWYWEAPAGKIPTQIIFSNSGNDQTSDLQFVNGAVYKCDGSYSNPNPNPNPNPTPGAVTIRGDYNLAYEGSFSHVHYWGGVAESTWPGIEMTTATGSDGKTYKVAKVADGTTGLVFNNNGNGQTGDITYSNQYVMGDNGATGTAVTFTGLNSQASVEAAQNVTVSVLRGTIVLSGLEAGSTILVAGIDGKICLSGCADDEHMSINIAPGFYIVKTGAVSTRVLVR